MFSPVYRGCFSKVVIAPLLGKPSPVCVLQYGTLHHGITSISQEREEKWKINSLSWRPGGHLWVNDISIQIRVCQWNFLFWNFYLLCLIHHILKTQSGKLFYIIGFYHKTLICINLFFMMQCSLNTLWIISSSYIDLNFCVISIICNSRNTSTRMRTNYEQWKKQACIYFDSICLLNLAWLLLTSGIQIRL